MTAGFLDGYASDRRDAFMSHVKPEFIAWLREKTKGGRRVSEADLIDVRMNSYEQELLYPHLDDMALYLRAAYYLRNCSRPDPERPCKHYDHAMMVIMLPLLLDRLRERLSNVPEQGIAESYLPGRHYSDPFSGVTKAVYGDDVVNQAIATPKDPSREVIVVVGRGCVESVYAADPSLDVSVYDKDVGAIEDDSENADDFETRIERLTEVL